MIIKNDDIMIPSTESTRLLVSDVIQELVEHYRQDVHRLAHNDELPSFATTDDTPNSVVARTPPAVVRYQLERLCYPNNNNNASDTIQAVVSCYKSHIRPVLFSEQSVVQPNGIAVLAMYELLLSLCFEHQHQLHHHHQQQQQEGTTFERNRSSDWDDTVLETLACDITMATASLAPSGDDRVPIYLRANVLVPTLIHLLTNLLDWFQKMNYPVSIPVLRRCAVSVLAIGVPTLGPQVVDGSLQNRVRHVLSDCCSYPPQEWMDCDMDDNLFDWSSLVVHGMLWNDPDTRVSQRCAERFWVAACHLVDNHSSSITTLKDPQSCKRRLCRQLLPGMPQAIRAHFFGRDMVETVSPPARTRLHMGFTISDTPQSDLAERPYQTTPSRLHATMHYLMLLEDVTSDMLDELLPICYELLASLSPPTNALGAAAVSHLLLLVCCKESSAALSEVQVSNLLQLVDKLVQTTRDGTVLLVVGMLHRDLLQLQPHRRRAATHRILTILNRNIQRSHDALVLSLLILLIALLYDHARYANADALELTRLCLTALLPLLNDDNTPRTVILASLTALLNIMVAAHPLMPHHGGKIMATVLNVWHRMKGDKAVALLAKHTAQAALIVGGEASKEVLQVAVRDEYEHGLKILARSLLTAETERSVILPS